MISLDQEMLDLIHSRGWWESLEDDEAELLYSVASRIPCGSRIVEIGCELGRSSVLLATAAKKWRFDLTFIDIWVSGPKYAAEWVAAVHAIGHPFTLHCRRSETVSFTWPIHLFYIDGDHTRDGVEADCRHFLPLVARGGYVAFHDYGRGGTPDVKAVADHYMDAIEWEHFATARTMAVWRKK